MTQTKTELLIYTSKFQAELENILAWWQKFSLEKNGDGFYGAADLEGNPVLHANKSCVLNTRILWTFSAAAKMFANKGYQQVANRAFKVVTEKFADKDFGGFFMELSPDNKVANDIKHTYTQAFAIYSMCKYYELNPDQEVLRLIQENFKLFEDKTKDKDNTGYIEAFTRDWKPIKENRMADNNEPKSMNTHLHILEAYAALYKVWKNDLLKQRLTELMTIFLDNIIREDGHLGIFFDESFNETETSKGICSFGHDIEASWLLYEAAEILGNDEIIEKMKTLSIKMADAVKRVGIDEDGGLFLESTRFGSHIKTNKHWWLQAETLVGYMNAYELSKDKKHWETVKLSWNFINKYVIDHERGEWYTKVNRLGIPYLVEPKDDPSPYYRNDWKIDPWKCPYHNGRAMMELIGRIDSLI